MPTAKNLFIAASANRYARASDASSESLVAFGTNRFVALWDAAFSLALSLEGHEDWVRCLSFDYPSGATPNRHTLTLATGSQDGNIRLWIIEPQSDSVSGKDDIIAAFEKSLGDFGDGEGGRRISNRSHVLAAREDNGSVKRFTVTFDALLVGHENHVTALSWRPTQTLHDAEVPTLLSCSTDASLILWSPTASPSPLWINRHRFGDIGGGKAGGFVGALWGRNGDEVMGWGWSGGWRRWRKLQGAGRNETWGEVNAITGPQGPVKGLCWDPRGEYLVSSSLDRTTRIFGPWKRPHPERPQEIIETWHELARPQIHGYDLITSAFVTSLRFVSVADEKVARVFDAPRGFVQALVGLGATDAVAEVAEARPIGASVPPLGLSNKAATDDDETFRERDTAPASRPPFEGELSNITLWPEVEKLFGHGYEVSTHLISVIITRSPNPPIKLYALGVSHSSSLVATACKATTAEHAMIRLYDTATWRAVGSPLAGHALTVTRIAFSPDDRFILSSSRDRTWRLFERQADGTYVPLAAEKGHARIIWDCAWSSDGRIFATAGRDKLVKIWKSQDESNKVWKAISTIKVDDAATAIDFAAPDDDGRQRLAVGLENGTLLIFSSPIDKSSEWTLELTIDSSLAHVDQIHRIAWQPHTEKVGKAGPGIRNKRIATAGEDGTLRVLELAWE
ncbi:hypothetical protein FRB99_005432 [Tulasnella sp. 403]|nr:hypothetical protein FRB99_005432 [Tulasnella sp. 403]